MAEVVYMPKLSDTMTEGVVSEWTKKVGDKVKDDDILADVETDKATMEVMGYATGTLLHVGVQKGEAAKVNGIIAIRAGIRTDQPVHSRRPVRLCAGRGKGCRAQQSGSGI